MFRLCRLQINEKNQILNIGVFQKINIFIKTGIYFFKAFVLILTNLYGYIWILHQKLIRYGYFHLFMKIISLKNNGKQNMKFYGNMKHALQKLQ